MSKDPLAQTEFFAKDSNENIQRIQLEIQVPERQDPDTVVCEYRMEVEGEPPRDKSAYGATSWQALTLALSILQLELKLQLASATLFWELTDAQNDADALDLSDLFGGLETQF